MIGKVFYWVLNMSITAAVTAETGVLLGAHLMCPNSTDIISELSQAIANRMTAVQLLAAMRPHPTFEEALTEALRDLIAKLNK